MREDLEREVLDQVLLLSNECSVERLSRSTSKGLDLHNAMLTAISIDYARSCVDICQHSFVTRI